MDFFLRSCIVIHIETNSRGAVANSASTSNATVEINSPLYLHPYTPGINLMPYRLTTNHNDNPWSPAMSISLLAKKQDGFYR